MADTDKQPAEGFVIININDKSHAGPVRGGVNGRTYEVKTGSDQTVPAWVAQSLRDTNYDFRLVAGNLGDGEGGAEGSASSSPASTTLTGTAIRGEPALSDGVAGTPMAASLLSAEPPLLGEVGGAQSGSAGQAGNATGATKAPVTGNNDDDALVEGSVADVVGKIDADTDLDTLKAAEDDREKPRSGVLKAIEKERARRASAEEARRAALTDEEREAEDKAAAEKDA